MAAASPAPRVSDGKRFRTMTALTFHKNPRRPSRPDAPRSRRCDTASPTAPGRPSTRDALDLCRPGVLTVRRAISFAVVTLALGCDTSDPPPFIPGTPVYSVPVNLPAAGPAIPGWDLVFQDEFDGSVLDPAKWAAVSGSASEQYGYNGLLDTQQVVAHAGQFAGASGVMEFKIDTTMQDGKPIYRAGHIESAFNDDTGPMGMFRFGRFEARLKLPPLGNAVAAFWLWGGSSETGWGILPSTYWEVDIIEHKHPFNFGTGVHNQDDLWCEKVPANLNPQVRRSRPPTNCRGATYVTPVPYASPASTPQEKATRVDLVNQWNTYAFEWDPDEIRFYLNGALIRTEKERKVRGAMRLVLGAMGGWVLCNDKQDGLDDAEFCCKHSDQCQDPYAYSGSYLADYVRVYVRSGESPSLEAWGSRHLYPGSASTDLDVDAQYHFENIWKGAQFTWTNPGGGLTLDRTSQARVNIKADPLSTPAVTAVDLAIRYPTGVVKHTTFPVYFHRPTDPVVPPDVEFVQWNPTFCAYVARVRNPRPDQEYQYSVDGGATWKDFGAFDMTRYSGLSGQTQAVTYALQPVEVISDVLDPFVASIPDGTFMARVKGQVTASSVDTSGTHNYVAPARMSAPVGAQQLNAQRCRYRLSVAPRPDITRYRWTLEDAAGHPLHSWESASPTMVESIADYLPKGGPVTVRVQAIQWQNVLVGNNLTCGYIDDPGVTKQLTCPKGGPL